jgi:hypothetical protein
MNTEHDDFARQRPLLDRALREQIKAPVMDAAFRKRVFARIALQRVELARAAASPASRTLLRVRLLLQLANIGAAAIAGALLLRAAMPWMGSLLVATPVSEGWALPIYVTVAGAALLYGLRHVRMPGWLRGLDI